MLLLFVIIFLCALVCFGAAAAGLWPKINLLALGLFLFTLVPFIQAANRTF